MKYTKPSPQNYVSLILGEEIRINHVSAEVVQQLITLGAYERIVNSEVVWTIQAEDEQALGKIMGQLRDMGIMFVGGPAGWPPAEVFDYLREKGQISGDFQEILWYRPANWFVRTR